MKHTRDSIELRRLVNEWPGQHPEPIESAAEALHKAEQVERDVLAELGRRRNLAETATNDVLNGAIGEALDKIGAANTELTQKQRKLIDSAIREHVGHGRRIITENWLALHDELSEQAETTLADLYEQTCQIIDPVDFWKQLHKACSSYEILATPHSAPPGNIIPTLPNVSTYPAMAMAWARMHELTDQYRTIRQAAVHLRNIVGAGHNRTSLLTPASRHVMQYLDMVPELLHLPLAKAAGWQPGIYLPGNGQTPEPPMGERRNTRVVKL